MPEEAANPRDFIRDMVDEDNRTLRWGTFPDGRPRVHTRFPPEPNGYLHIGHAKSINLNYGLAAQYGGKFNLRFDDTNPVKEEQEYVDSIVTDVRWLGARWEGMREQSGQPAAAHDSTGVLFASDYFQQMYDWAIELIRKGRAFVCDLSAEQTSRTRGTLTTAGQNSPFRDRAVAENLDLFARMKAGEFPDGARTLRAKIDMAHPNLNLRDPVMYRILHAEHHRTGKAWCIYPMYDWAHGFEDSIEGITHSICTLEFENHRPLYDWFIDAVNEGRSADGSGPWGRRINHPQQIEFNRLNLTYTVMSKRRLLQLVQEKHVRGWDDPRMPTLAGLRRRGFTPEAIRAFCRDIGVSKYDGTIDVARLENAIREDLNRRAPRAMAVLAPLRLVIENWGDGGDPNRVEWLEAVNNPEDPAAGTRQVPFGRELFIEQDDFRETPPPKYWRLFPGNEVRLRYAYLVRCTGVTKDTAGNIVEVRCTYDPATRGGDAPDGRKVKSTIHWVSAAGSIAAEVRLYDHLFSRPDPDEVDQAVEWASSPCFASAGGAAAAGANPSGATAASGTPGAGRDWRSNLNPNSLVVLNDARVEPSLAAAPVGARFQFERQGYFCVDADSGPLPPSQAAAGAASSAAPRRLVFNRTVTLKDTWAKVEKKG